MACANIRSDPGGQPLAPTKITLTHQQ